MSDHWLWRLDASNWLRAADNELAMGVESVGSRRKAVTHARRAAGMALNGVLVNLRANGWSEQRCESEWGRSYIDHLRAMTSEGRELGGLPDEVREHARELLAIAPVRARDELVSLRARPEDARAIELATQLVAKARAAIESN